MFASINWSALTVILFVFGLLQLWRLSCNPGARKRNHAARMKALEMGQPDPALHSPWPRAFVSAAIGAGVPIATVCFAWLNSIHPRSHPSSQNGVWFIAFLVSAVAISCGTGLASYLLGSHGRAGEPAQAHAKPPAYDPESFEVVGNPR